MDQLIHGYSGGHKLIASSIELPPEARKVSLIMSDLSGPSIVDGFETYLTAYPLTTSGLYAIARTWYAPEMPRPGCVWTHTLLFNAKELGAISDWQQIESLFQRPDADAEWDHYKKALFLDAPAKHSEGRFENNALRLFVQALYSSPEQPAVALAREAKQYESLAASLWLAQWPELRANFSFCTGAISTRKINGRALDLQVSPHTSLRQVKRESQGATIIDHLTITSANQNPWVEVVSKAIIGATNDDFSLFARNVGAKVPATRASYRVLAELFTLRNQAVHSIGFDGLVSALVRSCRESGEWLPISFLLENPTVLHGMGVNEASREQLILSLARMKMTPQLEKMAPRAAELLTTEDQTRPLHLAAELATENLNEFGEAVLVAIIDSSNPEQVLRSIPNSRQLLYGMVRRKPEFAADVNLWRAAQSFHGEILDAIIAAQPTADVLQSVVAAMLHAGVEPWSTRFVSLSPDIVIGAILDGLAAQREAGSLWRRGLENYPSALMAWAKTHPDAPLWLLESVSQLIWIDAASNSAVPTDLWKTVSQRLNSEAQATDFLPLRSFILTSAFTDRSLKAVPLIEENFLPIHQALARGRLDSRSWDLIAQCLPSFSMFWDDRCERLRRGVIKLLANTGGSLATILKKADEETMGHVAKSCAASNEGLSLLSHSLNEAQRRELPKSVRRALREFEG